MKRCFKSQHIVKEGMSFLGEVFFVMIFPFISISKVMSLANPQKDAMQNPLYLMVSCWNLKLSSKLHVKNHLSKTSHKIILEPKIHHFDDINTSNKPPLVPRGT